MHLRSPDCYTRVIHMVLSMSRPTKHPKTGVYWLRKRVPNDLVDKLGRKEITKSLETRDPDEAKRKHSELLAELESQWANFRLGPRMITDREAHLLARPAGLQWFSNYRDNPSNQLLWHTSLYEGLWTKYPLPHVEPVEGIPGIADPIPGFMPLENLLSKPMRKLCIDEATRILTENGFADDEWSLRKTARAVAAALQKASLKLEKLEKGEFDSDDDWARSDPVAVSEMRREQSRVSSEKEPRSPSQTKQTLTGLLAAWWQEGKATGLKPSTYESYQNTFSSFIRFLKYDDYSKVQVQDIVAFKDYRLSTPSSKTGRIPSAKTVRDSDLSALKSVFGWAVRNGLRKDNPAANITIKLPKRLRLRSRSLTDAEAKSILTAARGHQRGNEHPKTFAAKRWVPWLCALTGARVGEIGQLRKEDVYQRDGIWLIRITPEAGTVKTNEAREVPLHQQLVELGFPAFVGGSSNGHLFLNVKPDSDPRGPLRGLKNRLAELARAVVPDPDVAPNHGWRHRFKTVGMEAGIPPRILDAIQGHAPRTVAESYGEVTVKAMAPEIAKIPRYDI
ncbi:MAG: hypothetical protein DCC69_10130 [Hyphomicrobiales bacterium]|nr:MAG: hypothetical protein DCC69_10130 [Hyphomicrobiales bacterium]